MSEKLYLNPNDLEVLLCISKGIDHQYEIQKELRMAISTVHKRVKRLKKLGYIQESYLGSRGKVTYSLTGLGKEFAHPELLRILRLLNDQLSKIYIKKESREIPQVGLSPEAISGKLGMPLHITTKLLEKIYDTEVDGVVGRGMVDSNMVVIIDPKPTENPTTPSASSSPLYPDEINQNNGTNDEEGLNEMTRDLRRRYETLQHESRKGKREACVPRKITSQENAKENPIRIRDRARALDRQYQELRKAELEKIKNDFEEALKRACGNSGNPGNASENIGFFEEGPIRRWLKHRPTFVLEKPILASLDDDDADIAERSRRLLRKGILTVERD